MRRVYAMSFTTNLYCRGINATAIFLMNRPLYPSTSTAVILTLNIPAIIKMGLFENSFIEFNLERNNFHFALKISLFECFILHPGDK